jgi:effector-binding domain-containing protein
MPQLSEIGLYWIPEQPVLSVRKVIHFNEYPVLAGQVYAALQVLMDEFGIHPCAGPFVCYHNADLEHLDVEIGFPVGEKISGRDEMKFRIHPAGLCAASIFQGPYGETDPLMFRIQEWLSARGISSAGRIYNDYLNETSFPPEQWLTRIRIPVAG